MTRSALPSSLPRMSRLPFELLLALRYLRPKRTFVSVITLISILGVMLGVAVLIIVISVMSGFDHDLREKVFGFNAHLKVLAHDDNLRDYAYLTDRVAANPHVQGVAPFVLGQVLVVNAQAMVFGDVGLVECDHHWDAHIQQVRGQV